MAVSELRKNDMMAHLLDSLEAGKDIGHYGRLVFAMVARHFLSEAETARASAFAGYYGDLIRSGKLAQHC